MKIFRLYRDNYDYDEFDAKIVVAKNEKRAREIANLDTGGEGKIWTDEKLVKCEVVETKTEREVLGSFNAG